MFATAEVDGEAIYPPLRFGSSSGDGGQGVVAISTIVKEDIASAQIMAEMCPATIGKNAKFDANIKTLVQSYLADYADKSMTYEKIQSDSEYKSLLDEARQVAKETPKDEQQSVCNDVLNYQA